MKKASPTKAASKEQFEAAQARWFQDHDNFVKWWKNHRHSGFCFKKDQLGRELFRWSIHPVAAWNTPAYKVEYHDSIGQTIPETEEFAEYVRLQWRKDQARVERLSERLGTTFDAKHNQKVYATLRAEYGAETGFGFSGFANAHKDDPDVWPEKSSGKSAEWTAESMKAKIDKAYEYEPGQSEEETEALRRRRE